MKKFFNIRLICAMMAVLSLAACTKSNTEDPDDPTVEPGKEVIFPEFKEITYQAGEEYSVSFTPTYKWSMEADKSWIRFKYDGQEASNIAGPAGQEEVTVTLIITEQPDLSETISGSVFLTIGEKKEKVMTISQNVTFTSEDFNVMIADSDQEATEISLDWDSSINVFQSIITISAPFDWVIAGDTEWMDTSDLSLAGEASEEPTRIIVRPNMAEYPAQDEQYTLRFENKTNSEIAYEVKVNVSSCANSMFIIDGYSILSDGVDFAADGTIESNSPSPVDYVNFNVMVYGDQEPVIIMPKCWYESSVVAFSNSNPLSGRIEATTDFSLTLSEKVEKGNFTQYNYKIQTPAGEPAMASIFLFLKSGNPIKVFDNVKVEQLGGIFTMISSGEYGSRGNYRLPELAKPYFYGVVTRDGGPYDAAAIPFKLINSTEMNDASFGRMTPDRALYPQLVELVKSPVDLYSFVWNNCYDKNMNILLHEIPNLAKAYDHTSYNTDGSKSDWFAAKNTGDLGEEVLPQWFIQITPENVPSRNAAGYVTIKPKDGADKCTYVIEFEIVDPFTMVSNDSKATIGRMPSERNLYSKFSEAVSDKLNLYSFEWATSADGKTKKVYHNDLLLDEYEYTCYNNDASPSYDSERPTLSDTKSDWFTFHRAAATAGNKPTWWIELVEGKEITYPAKGYVTVKDPAAAENKPGSLIEESLFVIEFTINAE